MLDKFIKKEAAKLFPELFEKTEYFHPVENYNESVCRDALDDSWLDNNTTYIYKVGVYIVYDDNKLDWLYAFYGYQRRENDGFAFLGYLNLPQGENDDMSRTFETIHRHVQGTIFR